MFSLERGFYEAVMLGGSGLSVGTVDSCDAPYLLSAQSSCFSKSFALMSSCRLDSSSCIRLRGLSGFIAMHF